MEVVNLLGLVFIYFLIMVRKWENLKCHSEVRSADMIIGDIVMV